MNKDQRKELKNAIDALEQAKLLIIQAKEIVEQVGEEEQDKFDNLNEGMQAMDANQKLEELASALSDIGGELDGLDSSIDDQISEIQNVIEA